MKNPQIVNIDSGYSSAITFSEFLIKYNYRYFYEIEYYGIGICDKLFYNKIFNKNTLWDEKKVKIVRNKIIDYVKKYNIKCKFN